MSQSVHYCFALDGYEDFVEHIGALRLYRTVKPETFRKVLVTADPSVTDKVNGYWGYFCNKENQFVHIYRGLTCLQICSPSFFEQNISRGEGFISGLHIQEIELTEEEITVALR
jgi:hypothetical protein